MNNAPLSISLDISDVKTALPLVKHDTMHRVRLANIEQTTNDKGTTLVAEMMRSDLDDTKRDALCRRLGVDNSMRGNHNAILDCQLLAQVYLEMMGGKQPGLELASKAAPRLVALDVEAVERAALLITPPAEALAAHEAFVKAKIKEAIWLKPPFAPEAES